MVKTAWMMALMLLPLVSFSNTDPLPKIVKIYSAASNAFAGLKDDGSIEAWGSTDYGGTLPAAVSDTLEGRRVKEIYPGNCAFAALTEGGMVVTWGGANCGGDSSAVASSLASGVKEVVPTKGRTDIYGIEGGAFAALKNDGSVITWGKDHMGGDATGLSSQLAGGVSKVVANDLNFAALKENGSVVTWGWNGTNNFLYWSDYYRSQIDPFHSLQSGVRDIFASEESFIALKNDNSVIVWGRGRDMDPVRISQSIQNSNHNIVNIFFTEGAYAALVDNGSLLVWGGQDWGGNYFAVNNQLRSGVSQVFSARSTFAAIKENGTVVTWGAIWGRESNRYAGAAWEIGNSESDDVEVDLNVSGVKTVKIVSNRHAFAALKDDGSIVLWGLKEYGADNTAAVAAIGQDTVAHIESSHHAFAALKTNGSVVSWGNGSYGGDTSSVSSQLTSEVIQIVGSNRAFSALKSDGSVVVWGYVN